MLNAEILAAMPAMNDASRPAMATPRRPLGNRSRMRYKMASFGAAEPSAMSPTMTEATMPGSTTRNGINIFGNAPRMGVFRAAEIESDAIARWTSTKLVVQ